MKKKLLNSSKFYCILDYSTLKGQDIIGIAKKIILSGVDLVQLRFKPALRDKNEVKLSKVIRDAQRILEVAKKHKTPFLINDRVDVAVILNADGVHLGQQDLPLSFARKILGKKKIIGVSCHSLAQALSAQKEGADYLSIGPIFPTPTKPEYRPVSFSLISRVKEKIKVPFFVIGGIDLSNLNKVLNAGAERIALVRAVCCARDIAGVIKKFKSQLIRIEN